MQIKAPVQHFNDDWK